MAVANGGNRSLAPSYEQILSALQERAKLELARPQDLSIATQGVKRVDAELTNAREFEKKMRAEGKQLFTPEMSSELEQETGLPEGTFKDLQGLYLGPKDLETFATQKIFLEGRKKLRDEKVLSPGEAAVFDATGTEGQEALAESTFSVDKPVNPEAHNVTFPDQSSPTGFSQQLQDKVSGQFFGPRTPASPPSSGRTRGMADLQKQRIDLASQEQNVNQLEQMLTNIDSGAKGKLGTWAARVGQVAGVPINADNVTYEDLRPAYAAGLYKTLTNDRQISNADAAARALPITPAQIDAPNVRKAKTSIIRRSISIRRKLVSEMINNPNLTDDQIDAIIAEANQADPVLNPVLAPEAIKEELKALDGETKSPKSKKTVESQTGDPRIKAVRAKKK